MSLFNIVLNLFLALYYTYEYIIITAFNFQPTFLISSLENRGCITIFKIQYLYAIKKENIRHN